MLYLPKDPGTERKYQFSLSETMMKRHDMRHGIFSHQHWTIDIADKNKAAITKRIMDANGVKWCKHSNNVDKFVVVDSPADLQAANDKDAQRVTFDAIMTAILRQDLSY